MDGDYGISFQYHPHFWCGLGVIGFRPLPGSDIHQFREKFTNYTSKGLTSSLSKILWECFQFVKKHSTGLAEISEIKKIGTAKYNSAARRAIGRIHNRPELYGINCGILRDRYFRTPD
jgi:hypothetical protein